MQKWEKIRNMGKILARKPEAKGVLSGNIRRYEDNIKRNFKQTGCGLD